MSIKRRATTDLNHENWDQEEKDEQEMGSYKIASDDVLEKRVIRTAKRRFQNLGDEAKKPVFSGFGGFNKTQPSSFDFLANLTNGSKSNNAAATSNTTTSSISSNLFGNISSNSVFTPAVTSTTVTKPIFGKLSTETTSVFGAATSSPSASIFTASKTISVTQNNDPLKPPGASAFAMSSFSTKSSEKPTTPLSSTMFGAATSSPSASIFTASKTISVTQNNDPLKPPGASAFAMSSFSTKSSEKPTTPLSSTIFGAASSSSNNNKSLFTSSSPTVFQAQPSLSASPQTTNSAKATDSESKSKESNTDSENIKPKSKLNYYIKLKGLNESVLDWIKKNVEETPLCILTPIFQGYEDYLKKIQEEYKNDKKEEEKVANNLTQKTSNEETPIKSLTAPVNSLGTSNISSSSTPKSIFGIQKTTQTPNFSFGFTSTPSTNTTSSGFTFGVSSTQSTSTTSSPFVTSNLTPNTNGKAPFSFGSDKPFSFNTNIQVQQTTEKSNENDEDEDEPPKVEFTPVVEENSVFDKRCKIFIKKDGNFVDKGVGTLYIKKIQDSEKHQLLVRANTNLGNVLLNLVLSSAIPTQLTGKTNVMMVCIPSPDAKPPPVPILIRVKTAEEAEELLNTLNKYKG